MYSPTYVKIYIYILMKIPRKNMYEERETRRMRGEGIKGGGEGRGGKRKEKFSKGSTLRC